MALKTNVFKTITQVVPTSSTLIYTAPTGYSAVILLLQVANISTTTSYDVTVVHNRGAVDTELFKTFPVPFKDTVNLLQGKLVLESGDKLYLSGSNGSNLKFVASILETIN
jgi:hypothetical protein